MRIHLNILKHVILFYQIPLRKPKSGIQRDESVLWGGVLRPVPIQRPLHGKRRGHRRGTDAVGVGRRLAGWAGARRATARRRARPPYARTRPTTQTYSHLPRARLRRTRLRRNSRGPFTCRFRGLLRLVNPWLRTWILVDVPLGTCFNDFLIHGRLVQTTPDM